MKIKRDNKKKVVVTGGAGFIGSHLCERLLNEGHFVICIDNFYSGKRENLRSFFKNKNFFFIKANINVAAAWRQKLRSKHIDWIFNLACPASPVAYQRDPVETVRTNVLGMANVLDFADTKKARVLQASTSEIYGDPLEHPQKETYWGNVNPLSPRGCYDEGKRCAETLCFDYMRERGVDVKIVRIFNTYGPYMAEDDGRVVSNFIVQALKGDSLTIYGDGNQTRSFQYIDDLIEGMMRMMEKNNFSGPVNLGNPSEFTVGELAKLVLKLTGSKSKIVYRKLPSGDPQRRRPSIALAGKKLNWRPRTSLKEGLMKTVRYFTKL